MIRRLAPLFSLCLALTLGCGAPTAVEEPFEYGDPFWVSLGQRAVSADASTIVRFVRVIGDSRCLPPMVCVWAGEAVIEVGVTVPPAAEQLVSLRLGPEYGLSSVPEAAEVHGRVVRVLDLTSWLETGGTNGDAVPRTRLQVTAVR